ncbi:GNAT family N-acetyltransferase [Streptosporangium sp. NPDC050855]|uniref:GNAT family N-acetyltransferase n=1 Tax=Streptosporangium sp. NPDC050855 TaxID=3366194 RepID=UPI0037AE4830
MLIRFGTRDDAEHIAVLHAESWLTAYAGIMPDDYLNGPLLDERRSVWNARLTAAPEHDHPPCLLVAVEDTVLAGFVYLGLQADGRVLLDNLHVRPASRGSGIGHRLMRHAFAWAATRHPGRVLYLGVLRGNTSAIAFYRRLGGRPTREFVQRFPAGFDLPAVEYTWDPDAVRSLAGHRSAGDRQASGGGPPNPE